MSATDGAGGAPPAAPQAGPAASAPPPTSDATGAPETPTTVTFSCRSCNGALVFSPSARALACRQCGTQQPIEADDAPPGERSLDAALAQLRDPAAAAAAATQSGPAGGMAQELVCPNCHGRVGFVGTLTATRCPFCASPVQRSDLQAAPNRLPVDGVVPFGVDQADATTKVEAWIDGRWFAPTAFRKYGKAGSFSGVYLPFFTFDAATVTDYEGERGTTTTTGTGKDRRSHTSWRDVSGRVDVRFDDVTVGAESSLAPERLRELEPWPTPDAVAFRPEYLAGSLARSYERGLDECHVNSRERMTQEVEEAVKRDIGGDKQRIHRASTAWSEETYRHLLLPMFLLVVMFRAKPFQVFVNGVTGEVQGQRPYSWVKIASAVLAMIACLVAGFFAWDLVN